jgi:hypothetical protein
MFYNPEFIKQIKICIESINKKINKINLRINNIDEEIELDIRNIVSKRYNKNINLSYEELCNKVLKECKQKIIDSRKYQLIEMKRNLENYKDELDFKLKIILSNSI